jgi:hypothetical protein
MNAVTQSTRSRLTDGSNIVRVDVYSPARTNDAILIIEGGTFGVHINVSSNDSNVVSLLSTRIKVGRHRVPWQRGGND